MKHVKTPLIIYTSRQLLFFLYNSSLPFIRPLQSKAMFLMRWGFRYTEIVKYYSIVPLMKGQTSNKVTFHYRRVGWPYKGETIVISMLYYNLKQCWYNYWFISIKGKKGRNMCIKITEYVLSLKTHKSLNI